MESRAETIKAGVLSLLDYDPSTGLFKRKATGEPVGVVDKKKGYVRIWLLGRPHVAHRLAWLVTHAVWPDGDIDHINGVRHDNRIDNLRVVTRAENMMNQRRANSDSSHGFLGVAKAGNRWRASIKVDGKKKSLGRYDTPEEAHVAYVAAKRLHHPTCTI